VNGENESMEEVPTVCTQLTSMLLVGWSLFFLNKSFMFSTLFKSRYSAIHLKKILEVIWKPLKCEWWKWEHVRGGYGWKWEWSGIDW
jgi:hypothetical protein